MTLSFTYTPHDHWSEATLSDGTTEVSMLVWDVTDALQDVVNAVIASMRGAERVTCIWEDEDEQGQYRWVLERIGEEVQVTILWVAGAFNKRLDDAGTPLWATRCAVRKLAMVVLNQLWHLLQQGGVAGYKQQVRRYDFPLAEYKTLEELIRTYPWH